MKEKQTLFYDATVFPKVCINSFEITANSAKLARCVLRLLRSIYALIKHNKFFLPLVILWNIKYQMGVLHLLRSIYAQFHHA